jgi:NAD(P)-dependent dehydrogenase (short-subunit alcohol dehydrogenase family)
VLDTPQPPQEQEQQPGIESVMEPLPEVALAESPGGRLQDKVAIVTGGDSGIGRAVAVAFAREGADVAILYLDEHSDAEETEAMVAEEGRRSVAIAGDIGEEGHCAAAVEQAVRELGRLDVLVNNAAEQHPVDDLTQIGAEQLERTSSRCSS